MSNVFLASLQHSVLYIASVYNSSSYNNSTYNGQEGGTAAGSSAGGLLTNTGFDVSIAIAAASVLIIIALVVRIWRRPSSKTNA